MGTRLAGLLLIALLTASSSSPAGNKAMMEAMAQDLVERHQEVFEPLMSARPDGHYRLTAKILLDHNGRSEMIRLGEFPDDYGDNEDNRTRTEAISIRPILSPVMGAGAALDPVLPSSSASGHFVQPIKAPTSPALGGGRTLSE